MELDIHELEGDKRLENTTRKGEETGAHHQRPEGLRTIGQPNEKQRTGLAKKGGRITANILTKGKSSGWGQVKAQSYLGERGLIDNCGNG